MLLLILIALTLAVSFIIPVVYAQPNNLVSIVSDASTLGDKAYNPSPITISQGDTVTWANKDFSIHTVTENNGVFGSEDPDRIKLLNTDSKNQVLLIIIANYIP